MSSKSNYIAAISRKITTLHVVVLFVAYVVFSLVIGGAGILHSEMDTRLPAHISRKPILQIIFDADSMNIGGWEARQLSFFFDIIDGNFVAFCIRHGIPHFRSFTHYLFTLIIMLYLWSFQTHILRLDRLLSLLVIALLLTTPSFIYAYYYRTSKIGVSLMVLFLLGETYKVIRGDTYISIKSPRPFWLALIFLLATLSLMLFDVLGGLFATVFIAYLFFAWLHKPDKTRLAALAGAGTGYAIWVIYFLFLGPAITVAITGQKADTSYLTGVPFQYFIVVLLLGIPPLLIDMMRYLFGYIPRSGGVILLACMIGASVRLTIKPRKKTPPVLHPRVPIIDHKHHRQNILVKLRIFLSRFEPILSMLFLLGGIAAAYDLLVTRHPPIMWPDVRPTYYIMPAQVVLLFGTITLLARARIKWFLRRPLPQILASVLLTVFLLGNFIGSIQINDLLLNGKNTRLYTHSPALINALGHINTPGFKPDSIIATDPIYLMFSKP